MLKASFWQRTSLCARAHTYTHVHTRADRRLPRVHLGMCLWRPEEMLSFLHKFLLFCLFTVRTKEQQGSQGKGQKPQSLGPIHYSWLRTLSDRDTKWSIVFSIPCRNLNSLKPFGDLLSHQTPVSGFTNLLPLLTLLTPWKIAFLFTPPNKVPSIQGCLLTLIVWALVSELLPADLHPLELRAPVIHLQ